VRPIWNRYWPSRRTWPCRPISRRSHEKGKPPAITEPKEDKGFVAGLKSGWNAFTAAFTSIATAVGALLPFLVLLAIILVPLWLFRSKLRRRPAALPPPAANSGQ
jgi:hypothetical protein